MHRHLQIGLRENPASDRRHGSRFTIREELSNQTKAGDPEQSPEVTGSLLASGKSEDGRRSRTTAYKDDFEPLISSGSAARLLGNIHVKTLQRYARIGRLPGYQIAGHWYFRESELDAWVRHQISSNRQPADRVYFTQEKDK